MILELLHSLPEFKKKFEKTIKRIKAGIITATAFFCGVLLYFIITEFTKSGRYEVMWNLELEKQKALTAYNKGKYEEAKNIIFKVMQDEEYKYDSWCHYMLGLIYYHQDNKQKALESLKTAQQLGIYEPLPRLHTINLIKALSQ